MGKCIRDLPAGKRIVCEYIGRKIRENRELHDQKLDDLGLVLNCHKASISNYERGKQAIPITDLLKLSWHFGTPIQFLIPNEAMVDYIYEEEMNYKIKNSIGEVETFDDL